MTAGPIGTEPAPVPDEARQWLVRMQDGVRLATDVYLPEGEGSFPAILVRLPYDKNSRYVFMREIARRATRSGYAMVVQDVRGKYRSEGQAMGLTSEANDGYDTISWITASEWSDGRVGMFGDSYYGFTQYAAVSSGHPALRAIVPRVTSTQLGINDLVEGDGVADIPWLTGATYLLQCWSGAYVNQRVPDFKIRPLTAAFEQQFAELGRRSAWYDATIPHPVPLKAYPNRHPLESRPVPTMHCIGWWDNLAIAHMRDVEAFASVPGWAALQYLWLDSIDHENYHISEAGVLPWGDHDSDDAALERMLDVYIEPALRFFDVFVKGNGGPDSIPRVQWHMAHVGYQEAGSWPPAGATVRPFYLRNLARMTTAGGMLSLNPPTESDSGHWRLDPEDPVMSPAASSWSFLASYPDERATANRPDVAVFDTDPLPEAMDLAGPVRLWTRVSSTARTADVFARLLDVDPDGSAHLVVRGQAELKSPDETSLRAIDLGHTGYRFRAGHRVRLQLASSDFPEYPLNPGDGSNRWLARDIQAADHTMLTDPVKPACLEMTVLACDHGGAE